MKRPTGTPFVRARYGRAWRRAPFAPSTVSRYYLAADNVGAEWEASITRDRTSRSAPWVLWHRATNTVTYHRLYREAKAEAVWQDFRFAALSKRGLSPSQALSDAEPPTTPDIDPAAVHAPPTPARKTLWDRIILALPLSHHSTPIEWPYWDAELQRIDLDYQPQISPTAVN